MDFNEKRLRDILSILSKNKLNLDDVEQMTSAEALEHYYLLNYYSSIEINQKLNHSLKRGLQENIKKYVDGCEFIETIRFNRMDYFKLNNSYYERKKEDIKKYIDIFKNLSIKKPKKKRILTKKTREKMRKSHLGLKHSEQTRKKMGKSHIGLKPSDETRKKMSKSNLLSQANSRGSTARRPVFQIDLITKKTIDCFESMHKASRMTGISNSNICDVCQDKLISAGGFGWRYVTEKVNEN